MYSLPSTHRLRKKNWHCNPNMSLILPQEAFFHKGISSVSLEENIILSSNMLSNKVAPILVCWFKSVSGYADTVSAACKPQPAHMFWMRASDWIWLLWLLFCKYLPAYRAGRHRLAKGEKKKKREKIKGWAFGVFSTQPEHDTRPRKFNDRFLYLNKNVFLWNKRGGYCISLWTNFWLILLSNKLSLRSQKKIVV